MKENDIAKLLDDSEEQLYIKLGIYLIQKEEGYIAVAEPPKSISYNKGVTWFEQNRSDLQKQICQSDLIRIYREDPSIERKIFIITGIADLIAPFAGGIGAFTIAALILKEGLASFCKSYFA
jgi:hypothetical protein